MPREATTSVDIDIIVERLQMLASTKIAVFPKLLGSSVV